MNADDYFIKVLKVSDSLGNIWDKSSGSRALVTDSILRVGDTIELLVDAYDPKGREITYKISSIGYENEIVNKVGKFTIDVAKEMISQLICIDITVSTEESEYKNKQRISFYYTVLP